MKWIFVGKIYTDSLKLEQSIRTATRTVFLPRVVRPLEYEGGPEIQNDLATG